MWNAPIITVRPAEKVIFPLDERWQLDQGGYSPRLSYQLLWLSGLVTFAHAHQILEDIGQISVATTTLWEQVQVHGERLCEHVSQSQEHVSVERTRWNRQQYDPKMTRCVSIDGGMVCLRQEGWKEMKVGLVSDFETDWDSNPMKTMWSQCMSIKVMSTRWIKFASSYSRMTSPNMRMAIISSKMSSFI